MKIEFFFLNDNGGCIDYWSDAKFVPRKGDIVCFGYSEYTIDEVKWTAPNIVKCIMS